jgi:3-hydroxyisobutyrate dehydrogenase
MSLGVKVGLDTEKLYEIISTAAGSSAMFVDRTPQLLSGKWTSKKTVNDVVSELVYFYLSSHSNFG